ncbi:MAG: hypothetical protein U0441_00385 [Polyangiaceae bacterium]
MEAQRPLSLDQFAAMTAEMEAGFPRDRVLEMASVSEEQWELTQETWLLRMAKQGQQRKLALLDRYNELLAKHRKAAQRKMRAEKRKLKGPMPVAPEAHLSPLARQQGDGGATFQKPSFADAPAPLIAPVAPAVPLVAPVVPGAPFTAPAVPGAPFTAPAVVGAPFTAPAVVSSPALVTPPPGAAFSAEAPFLASSDLEDDDEIGMTQVAAAIDVPDLPFTSGPSAVTPFTASAAGAPNTAGTPFAASTAGTPFTASTAGTPFAASTSGTPFAASTSGTPFASAPPVAAHGAPSIETTAAGERSPLAAGPAWLKTNASAPSPTETTQPEERSPLAGIAPSWLRVKGARGDDGPKAPPPAPPPNVPTAGPAWLQSSAGFTPPAIVAPPGAAPAVGSAATPPAAVSPAAAPPAGVSQGSETPRPAAAKKADLGATVGSDYVPSPFQGPAWAAAQARAAAKNEAARGGSTEATPFHRAGVPAKGPDGASAAKGPSAPAAPAGASAPPPSPRGSSPSAVETLPVGTKLTSTTSGGLPFARPATAQPPVSVRAPATAQPQANVPPAQPQANVPPAQPQANVPVAQPPSKAPVAQPPANVQAPANAPRATVPRLSLEQLAWLQAQMETSPELGRAAREKLSLSEADYAAERAFWQARFQQDRASLDRYTQVFYHYRRR